MSDNSSFFCLPVPPVGGLAPRTDVSEIVRVLQNSGAALSSAALSDVCRIPKRTIYRHLKRLTAAGIIERVVLTDTPVGNLYPTRYRLKGVS